ncbi:MAG: ATP-binding cassette domain-containing protein [Clostridia bacterium]|nr:ATP-binding cassette domain-containing protein [Clostridia bacterium]
MEILRVENLSFKYPTGKAPTLKELSFSVNEGEFVVLCGATGSGKSTLLRLLKRELAPLGEMSGAVCYDGRSLEQLDAQTAASEIGFVMQRPEQQIAADKVWHELALGLENLGESQDVIRRRCAEMAGYFGIAPWFDRETSKLSGGQKQLLNLAAVMAMNPRVLILDEPTAQLDPIAASDFIGTLLKINRELSLTVIIAEHRLEELIPVCDRLIALDCGEIVADAPPREALPLLASRPALLRMMPAASRLSMALGLETKGEVPLTVREGKRMIEEHYTNKVRSLPAKTPVAPEVNALEFRDVWFRYSQKGEDILRGTSFHVKQGEFFCILGANGSGKTTALGAVAAINRIFSGKIKIFGKQLKDYKNGTLYQSCLAWLPQDPQTLFLRNTLREELKGAEAEAAMLGLDLVKYADTHPYDLSGGEQQLAALARVLSTKPKLLLLDEPTKGLDAASRERITDILRRLRDGGMTILAVTHDAEFAADAADRCALFFRGEIVSTGTPREFFAANSFYTTAANRMTRGHYDGIVTLPEAVEICRLNGEAKA